VCVVNCSVAVVVAPRSFTDFPRSFTDFPRVDICVYVHDMYIHMYIDIGYIHVYDMDTRRKRRKKNMYISYIYIYMYIHIKIWIHAGDVAKKTCIYPIYIDVGYIHVYDMDTRR